MLTLEDCVKRDVMKAGEEEYWKKKTRYCTYEGGKDYQMRQWRSCGQHLTPDKDKRGRERQNLASRYY